jgi:hypothetical protein
MPDCRVTPLLGISQYIRIGVRVPALTWFANYYYYYYYHNYYY